jgi:hypothetical protein
VIVDDGILDHPKFIRAVRKAGSAAIHLWLGLMSWSKQQLSDGVIPVDVVPAVNGPPPRWRGRALEALIAEKLVERVSDSELRLHDFLDWNKSREQITLESASRKQAAKARRDRLRQHGEGGVTAERSPSDVVPTTERRRTDDAPTTERRPAVSNDNGPLDGRVPTPYPTLPVPSLSVPDQIPLVPPESEPPAAAAAESQTASTSSAPRGKPRKPRARTQCPVDLQPDETTAAMAWQLGFSDEHRDRVVREFVNYWRGEGALKADWQATLRNRLDNRAEFHGLKPRKPRDERWEKHQQNLRKATELTDAVPPPPGFEQAIGGLFGG